MQHYGDITKIKGAEVPIVDVVTGGSPCQDLSVAGKRAGLAGERSGLFMEQIRIIKEMRDEDKRLRPTRGADEYIRPRYMVWENVPGAFSSNKGEDFRCVLEETAKIADENAIIPRLATGKDGKQKWSKSGCIMGDGWSIAWRLHDAQFWGVPQRRKRISLVADFGGETAPEILFERESVFRDTTESGEARKGTAEDVRPGIEETGRAVSFQERAGKPGGGKGILIQNERTGALSTVNNQSVCAFEPGAASRLGGYCWEDKAGTLMANAVDNQQAVAILNPSDSQGNQVADSDGIYPTLRGCGGAGYQQGYLFERKNSTTVFGISSYNSNSMKSSNPHSGIYEAATSRTLDLNGGSPACNQGGMAVVQGADVYNGELTGEIAATLTNACGGSNTSGAKVLQSAGVDTYNQSVDIEVSQPLRAANGGDSTPKVVCIEGNGQRESHKGNGYKESDTMYTLNTVEQHAVAVENHPADSRVKIREDGMVQTLSSRMGTDGGNVPMVLEEPYNSTTGSFMRAGNSGVAETLAARDYKDPQIVCNSVVRRLTPLECERLQGYPDGWTDIGDWVDSKGKKHKGESDSPRYKALGNSIALPFWKWMAKRMRNYLGDNPTMASLFDGIGGFPLSYQEAGVKPVWASEIEEFPIAVTKIRFPD